MNSLKSRFERWKNLGSRAAQVFFQQGPATFLRLAYWKVRSTEAYDRWQRRQELTPAEFRRQKETAASFPYRPLISILIPVYNPPPGVLRDLIDSVRAQTYDHWELCLAEAGSEDPAIANMLEAYAAEDSRVRVQLLERNLGISANTTAALQAARGEFVALIDHDDTIAPNLLFECAQLLNEKPDTDLIYYDEDKLSADGSKRRDPLFKPGWSPEILLSANYLTHPVVRKTMFEEAGGLDPATDGAQDWDLMLRLSERTDRIEHIPKVLYHWRQLSGSTAGKHAAKTWVFDRQLAIVKSHLERKGLKEVETFFVQPGVVRAVWPVSGQKVSIIIPTKDKVAYLERCVRSILDKTGYPDYEIILVDTGSVEPATRRFYDSVVGEPGVRLVEYRSSFNYSAVNNWGVEKAEGRLLLFLNNDTEVLETDWLDELVRWVERPEIGVVGAKLLFPNSTIQHAGVIIGLEGHASHLFAGAHEHQGTIFGSVDWYRNYLAVTGACLMTRRDVFETVGGFNEDYLLAFSDIEYCVQVVQKGLRVAYTPFARLRHYAGRSRGAFIPPQDLKTGYEQLRDLILAGDPFFNPNLTYGSRMPALRPKNEVSRIERVETIMKSHLRIREDFD